MFRRSTYMYWRSMCSSLDLTIWGTVSWLSSYVINIYILLNSRLLFSKILLRQVLELNNQINYELSCSERPITTRSPVQRLSYIGMSVGYNASTCICKWKWNSDEDDSLWGRNLHVNRKPHFSAQALSKHYLHVHSFLKLGVEYLVVTV